MHDFNSPENILDHELAFSKTLLGKECARCRRAYHYNYFDRDSSSRDGRANVCPTCKRTPRLSIEENVARYKEMNDNSAAVDAQRRPDELDYLERDSVGRYLYHSELIHKLRKLVGTKLIIGDAFFLNEFSLYVEDRRAYDTNGVRYIGYIPAGRIQEFSSYRYDHHGIAVDETHRGYRGILMKLILNGYATEDQVRKIFGYTDEKIWNKTLYNYRNHK